MLVLAGGVNCPESPASSVPSLGDNCTAAQSFQSPMVGSVQLDLAS